MIQLDCNILWRHCFKSNKDNSILKKVYEKWLLCIFLKNHIPRFSTKFWYFLHETDFVANCAQKHHLSLIFPLNYIQLRFLCTIPWFTSVYFRPIWYQKLKTYMRLNQSQQKSFWEGNKMACLAKHDFWFIAYIRD